MKYLLYYVDGFIKKFPLRKTSITIGRTNDNDLIINEDFVSRKHLQVKAKKDHIIIKDLGSTNGTWLANGVQITEGTVPNGTVVRLGRSHVEISLLDELLPQPISSTPGFGEMIGVSASMRAVFALMSRVAPTNDTVLITGETGTGKELCARSLVAAGPRRDKPLVVVDCGALPPSLLENELFGHARGAFRVDCSPACAVGIDEAAHLGDFALVGHCQSP